MKELKEQLEELEKEIKKYRMKYEKIGKKIIRIHNKIEKVKNELWINKINLGKMGWEEILYVDDSECSNHHNYRTQQLEEIGLHASGYHADINQVAIQIHLYSKKDAIKSYNGLMSILKYLKPTNSSAIRGTHKNHIEIVLFPDDMFNYDDESITHCLFIDKEQEKWYWYDKPRYFLYMNSIPTKTGNLEELKDLLVTLSGV